MSGLLIVGSGYAGMNFTAVSKTSAAASAVIAKPHFLHSNVCTFGNAMGRKIDWANRVGLTASALRFCPVPNLINTKCQVLGGGHVKIDGIEQGITETPAGNLPARERYYRVTLHNGRKAIF
jgi:hypothetical protein